MTKTQQTRLDRLEAQTPPQDMAVVYEHEGHTYDRSPWGGKGEPVELTPEQVQALGETHMLFRVVYVQNWREPEKGTQ